MLFSTVYAPVLCLFGMQSIALANPVPKSNQHAPATSQLFVVGKLQSADHIQKRTFKDEAIGSDLERRAVYSWGPGRDQNEALRLHNVARAKHELSPLEWDTSLEDKAKAWARHLAETKEFKLEETNYGQSIAYYWSTEPTSDPITLATEGWLKTQEKYHNEVIPQGDFSSYAPYTQIVWRKTTRVGIATASDGNGTWYTVGYYSPAGNVVGSKPY